MAAGVAGELLPTADTVAVAAAGAGVVCVAATPGDATGAESAVDAAAAADAAEAAADTAATRERGSTNAGAAGFMPLVEGVVTSGMDSHDATPAPPSGLRKLGPATTVVGATAGAPTTAAVVAGVPQSKGTAYLHTLDKHNERKRE